MILNVDHMLNCISDVELTALLHELLGFHLANIKQVLHDVDHHIALRILNFDAFANLLNQLPHGML